MTKAQQHITVEVTDWPEWARDRAMRELNAIARELRRTEPVRLAPGGWTRETSEAFLSRLGASNGRRQVLAIRRAIENGGDVTREEVFELCGFDAADRSLKGFTRPARRVFHEMKEAGEIPVGAEEPFEPIYNEAIRSYQRALGFRVQASIVAIYPEAA